MNFNAGDKVVCVDDSIRPEALVELSIYVPNWVKKDDVYTVRETEDNDGIAPAIRLKEIYNPPCRHMYLNGVIQEPAFADWRFVLVEKAQYKFESEISEDVHADQYTEA